MDTNVFVASMFSSAQEKQESRVSPNIEKPTVPTASNSIAEPQQDVSLAEPLQIESPEQIDVSGWRRILLLTAVFVGLFLSFLDTTIVSVALVAIANQFEDFEHSTWVLTAYLLTYMAFGIIITRLSDIFGRKIVEVASFTLFIAFSLGCGLSRSMTQMIVFRALQGVGGSGLYSMTMVIALSVVPQRQRGILAGAVGITLVCSGVLGPILGGVITHNNDSSTWRWIFYLNLPVGGSALTLLLLTWPKSKTKTPFNLTLFRNVDFLGCILLLAASILLIFALQEAGSYVYAWSSGTIIGCLTVSAITFIAFTAWQQWLAAHPDFPVKPVFPVSVVRNRVIGVAIS